MVQTKQVFISYQCPLDHLILLVLVCSISVIVAINLARADEGEGASILLVLVLEISGIITMNWVRADEGEGAYQVHWLQEMVRWEVAEGVVLVVVLTGGQLGSSCCCFVPATIQVLLSGDTLQTLFPS